MIVKRNGGRSVVLFLGGELVQNFQAGAQTAESGEQTEEQTDPNDPGPQAELSPEPDGSQNEARKGRSHG